MLVSSPKVDDMVGLLTAPYMAELQNEERCGLTPENTCNTFSVAKSPRVFHQTYFYLHFVHNYSPRMSWPDGLNERSGNDFVSASERVRAISLPSW